MTSDMEGTGRRASGRFGGVPLVQVGISLAVLTLALSVIAPAGDVFGVLRRADARWLLAAGALAIVSETLSAWKWRMILGHVGRPVAFGWILRTYWIGMFYGTYLPGSVSGDAARVLLVRGRTGTLSAAVTVFMQRNTGLAAMLVMATGLAVAFPVEIELGVNIGPLAWPWLWFSVALAGYLAINGLLVSQRLGRVVERGAEWIPMPVVRRLVQRVLHIGTAARGLLRQCLSRAAVPVGLSFFTQVLDGIVVLLLAKALGLSLAFTGMYQAMAAVSLAGMLPVSFNGLGIREVGFALMGGSGLGATEAVALGLLTNGLYLSCALPGAFLHGGRLLESARRQAQEA